MRRSVLNEVGLFDETIRRGEDWELNLRIRAAGYRVWFDPTLAVTYWPRESWVRLARQFHATGTWRGELVRRYGRRNSVRFFAPPALVLALVLSLVVGVLQLTGVLTGGGRSRLPSSTCPCSRTRCWWWRSRWVAAGAGVGATSCGRLPCCRRST